MLRRLLKLEFKPVDLKKPTVIILILSNLLPIYGVLFSRVGGLSHLAAILDGKCHHRSFQHLKNGYMFPCQPCKVGSKVIFGSLLLYPLWNLYAGARNIYFHVVRRINYQGDGNS